MSKRILEYRFNIDDYICDVVLYESEKIVSVRVQNDKIVISYITDDCRNDSEDCVTYTFSVGGEGDAMGRFYYVDTLYYDGGLLYVLCDKEISK